MKRQYFKPSIYSGRLVSDDDNEDNGRPILALRRSKQRNMNSENENNSSELVVMNASNDSAESNSENTTKQSALSTYFILIMTFANQIKEEIQNLFG